MPGVCVARHQAPYLRLKVSSLQCCARPCRQPARDRGGQCSGAERAAAGGACHGQAGAPLLPLLLLPLPPEQQQLLGMKCSAGLAVHPPAHCLFHPTAEIRMCSHIARRRVSRRRSASAALRRSRPPGTGRCGRERAGPQQASQLQDAAGGLRGTKRLPPNRRAAAPLLWKQDRLQEELSMDQSEDDPWGA